MNERSNTRLDRFRVVCAVLVIAIHTSPLETLSPDADWLFTRVVARIAVPFFFMATGYFSREKLECGGLGRGLRKMLLLYAAAVVLYLPLNLYMGDLDHITFVSLLRDLFLDGTFYHLWYFPAVILGLSILRGAVKLLGWSKAGVLTALLYLIGLGGDSWHGLAVLLPGGSAFYERLFACMDYTRNGLFFAPVYLWLGGTLSRHRLDQGTSIVGFLLSFCALLAEAALLTSDVPADRKHLRVFSLLMYIIHPWCIVGLRLFARPLQLWNLLVENRFTAFFAVCLTSAMISALGTIFWLHINEKS